jgi:hypothetical protein
MGFKTHRRRAKKTQKKVHLCKEIIADLWDIEEERQKVSAMVNKTLYGGG